ncbi:DNA recombination protein RmuC [Mycoplasmatota bacterium]|nr:DNA recombination protein RmuC [Mycoplasmatota bacterium]
MIIVISLLSFLCLLNLYIVIKFFLIKENDEQFIKEMNDFKFHQQTQFLNIQKSLSEDFSNLRENIVININRYNEQTIKEFLSLHNKMNTDLYGFKDQLQKEMYQLFENLNRNISDSLDQINNKVELRLNEGFEKTTKTFNNILERISKIDEAQRKIESLSTNIISLQEVLTDKKSRGTFGEIQLKQILISTFGEHNSKVYELQKKLSNGKITDAILYTPEPLGNICIDSKFPLENYKKMMDNNLSLEEKNENKKRFKQDVKKHIDDIKNKYIIYNETSDSAIMFIPAEAIFAEINAYHSDLINYSQKAHVWIASPTTLMFLLTTVQVILQNIERDKYSAIIHEELNKLGTEFKRYKDRWDKLSRSIDQVSKNVKDLHTTSHKIEKHFDSISKADIEVKLDELSYTKLNEEEENETNSRKTVTSRY